ncbi:MAG: lysyl oxidase family protein [Actinomycetota bacterium]
MKKFKALIVVTAFAMALLPRLAGTAAGADVEQVPCADPRGCPDLVVDPETMNPSVHTKTFKENDCQVQEGTVDPGTRRILRFTYTTPNFGAGDLIVGRPEDHPEWFEFGECHGHFHFREYADYRLWTPDQYAQYEALRQQNPDLQASQVLAQNPGLQPIVGEKRGFCVIDIWPYQAAPPKYVLCDFQGISVGWADEYVSDLDSQFIDVTGVAPGTYVLEAEVNSERLFEESDYTNNWSTNTVQI